MRTKRTPRKPAPPPAAALVAPPRQFLTLDEVAARWRKNRSTIWRMVEDKILPAYNFAATSRRASWCVKLVDVEAHEARVCTVRAG